MTGNLRDIRDRGSLWRALLSALTACAMVGGCARPRQVQPDVDPTTLDDMSFQAYLADVPVVSVNEACRAMLILADGRDETKTWSERRSVMIERGLIRSAWGLQPDNVADRGTIAFMVCEVCRIKGGVNRLILASWGPGDRRYAYREVVYRKLMPGGSEHHHLTGGQMVSLMGKADAWMDEHGLYESEPIKIGEESEFVSP